MNNVFDTTPFPYVGNNKYYKDLSKEELDRLNKITVEKETLPSPNSIEESSASVVGPMLPQVGLTAEKEKPDVDNVLADINDDKMEALSNDETEIENMYIDDEFDLLKESLDDTVNGTDIYFESSKFIEKLKAKFKKEDVTEPKKIAYGKVMKVAKAYTEMKFTSARIKIALAQDSDIKGTSRYRQLQKKAINAEKEYRKLKKDLTKEEITALNDYVDGFDSTFTKKIDMQIKDIKEAKKAAIKKEYLEYADDIDTINILTESVKDDFYFEGVNWDLHKKYREDLKRARKKVVECVKYLKKHEYTDAKNTLTTAITEITTCKENALKEIKKIDDSKVITAICGFFLRNVTVICRDILALLLCAPAAIVRELIDGIKDTSNVSKKYQEKGYFVSGDFNTYVQFVEKDYDRILHILNRFLSKIDDIEKEHNDEEIVKKESCETECGTTEIVTEKDLDPGMKPILDKLHSKGYKTKASSSGHKNVITKDDGDRDNIRNGHHYGDARLVFDGKYNLGKAPKYWYWKKVDNSDEVEYLDIIQIAHDESPDNEDKFTNWKNQYMKSLTDWVDNLPDISRDTKETVEESVKDINDQINTLYESVVGDLMLEVLDI